MSSPNVQALFVDDSPHGIYPKLLGQENCWGLTNKRDARLYVGPDPIVAHPSCNLWVNFAAVNYARSLKEPNRRKVLPAWYPGGNDEGCFYSAMWSALCYGGVVEHPAYSHAWAHYGLAPPNPHRWTKEHIQIGTSPRTYWSCEVYQSTYGNLCQKKTWLIYCGKQPPFELDWSKTPATHQVGWFDRLRPTVSKREASATPLAFAETLIALAKWSRG